MHFVRFVIININIIINIFIIIIIITVGVIISGGCRDQDHCRGSQAHTLQVWRAQRVYEVARRQPRIQQLERQGGIAVLAHSHGEYQDEQQ